MPQVQVSGFELFTMESRLHKSHQVIRKTLPFWYFCTFLPINWCFFLNYYYFKARFFASVRVCVSHSSPERQGAITTEPLPRWHCVGALYGENSWKVVQGRIFFLISWEHQGIDWRSWVGTQLIEATLKLPADKMHVHESRWWFISPISSVFKTHLNLKGFGVFAWIWCASNRIKIILFRLKR